MSHYEVPNNYKNSKMMMLIVLAIIAAIGSYFKGGEFFPTPKSSDNSEIPSLVENDGPDSGEAKELTYNGKKVTLTRHAKCRMGCRKIDLTEIGEVLERGVINMRKSNPNDKPCPTFSFEGKSHDGQTCRIVIADCEDEARVITVIDLKNKYDCHCD